MAVLIVCWFLLSYIFIINCNMPPKKYTIDEVEKRFDEKLSSLKCNLVSDLKKEITNEIKALLREKDKEIEALK